MFVDQFDQEHSRDIEPMKGGHRDNYYYQMVGFIRRFKGVPAPEKTSASKPLSLRGGFDQWSDVAPEFRDDIGDTFHRDFPGYAGHQRYTNSSGRNDIIAAKISAGPEQVLFYVRAREPWTGTSGKSGPWLLIDSDRKHATGWEGYDWIINRLRSEGNRALLEQSEGNHGWEWSQKSTVHLIKGEKELVISIPREFFTSREGAPLHFDFKWVDNMPENGDIVSWLDAGDAAPNGRFNYQFEENR